MSRNLLFIAISFITVGMAGIFTTTKFVIPYGSDSGIFSRSAKAQMMGSGMMHHNHMMEMMQQMMSGPLPPGISPQSLPDPDSRGAKLLVHYCTQCHNLPSPAMHSSEEWPGVAQRMFNRLSMMSGMRGDGMGMMWMETPSVEEQGAIVAYLKAHSLKPIAPGTLPSLKLPEAVSFKNVCSQCHALPDPKLHTPNEWTGVVERMRINMRIMGKQVITDQEKNEIVGYLAKYARQ